MKEALKKIGQMDQQIHGYEQMLLNMQSDELKFQRIFRNDNNIVPSHLRIATFDHPPSK